MKTFVLGEGNTYTQFPKRYFKKLKLMDDVEIHVCSNTPPSETYRRNKNIKELITLF